MHEPILIQRVSGRWTVRDKMFVIRTVQDAPEHKVYVLNHYGISEEEFKEWTDKLGKFNTPRALRATRVQDYRVSKEEEVA